MTKQILLIHGDTDNLTVLKNHSWHHNYGICCAVTKKESVLKFKENNWGIIVADPFIGNGDIVQDLLRIKKQTPRVPLLILAAPEKMDKAMDLFSSKAISYLQLPVNPKALNLALMGASKNIALERKIDRYSERIAELHNAQDLLNQLFEEVPCYISVQDKNLRITAANKRFKLDFGGPIGGVCYEVFKHRTTPCSDCPVVATFQDGKSHTIEDIVTSKSGRQYNVLTQTAPIRNELGKITQVMEMSTDITQIRQLQDHLVSLGLMLGSMSHGVKGMLTALDGGIYQLETGIVQADENRVTKAFGQIQQMADKIKKMVLEILYYAKSRELSYELLDIADFAKNVIDSVTPIAKENDIRLDISIPDSLGQIEVDTNWMEAALVNFLENALDACILDANKAHHWIRFCVSKNKEGFISFSVEDNGTGMDAETRNKMFTLFFSSKGSQGTGLGMFIAHRVVRYHGGTIKVESKAGKGSNFTILLPFQKPDNLEDHEIFTRDIDDKERE